MTNDSTILKRLCGNIAAGRFNGCKYCTPQPYFGHKICVTPLHCSYGQIGYSVHFPYTDMPTVEFDWEMNKLTIGGLNWKSYLQKLTTNNMAQKFYTKWQNSVLVDAGSYVSKEYRNFQTALIREISNYAKAVDATVVSNIKGHYYTSCFVGRNDKFVYISHSSGLSRRADGVRIDLDSFLIRTAEHQKDYTGGNNHYCNLSKLLSMIDKLLTR